MSHVSTYYVAVHTGVDYPPDAYDEAAGSMVSVLTTLFADATALSQLTGAEFESASTEIEVSLEEGSEGRELVGKAVLDLMAIDKLKLDKGRLSKLIKSTADDRWPNMKIAKKLVPPSTDQNWPKREEVGERE
mgnify:CR=1 FL=1